MAASFLPIVRYEPTGTLPASAKYVGDTGSALASQMAFATPLTLDKVVIDLNIWMRTSADLPCR
jgi:hypothetical protein